MLNIRVPAGIGDISWVYSKFADIGEELNIYISKDEPQRSLDFVRLLPNVRQAQYAKENFHQIVDHCIDPLTPKKEVLDWCRKWITNVSANRWLEAGNRLEDFLPELPTNLHYKINHTSQDKIWADHILSGIKYPIGIYTSNIHAISCWNGWRYDTWKEFIISFLYNFPQATFIFLGAKWDEAFTKDLISLIPDMPHINLSGQTTTSQCIEIIRRLKYFIAFPSGLPILANVLCTPVTMFYPLHLEKIINTWPDPTSIQNGDYKGCIFPRENKTVTWGPEKNRRTRNVYRHSAQPSINWIFNEYKLKEKLKRGGI